MNKSKILKLTTCTVCPWFSLKDGQLCTNLDRRIEGEEIFEYEGNKIVGYNFPDWCPLEDYK